MNVLVPILYVGLTIILVWGWIRGLREKATPFRFRSRLGFVLGSSSAYTAIITAIWTRIPGLIQYHDPILVWIYRSGALLAVTGLVLSILGIRRPSALRWHAPILSSSMLLLWCMWLSGQ
jgi:uncharacterized membrane protein